MRRSPIRRRRPQHRRRDAPRWSPEEWENANHLLYVRGGGRCDCCGEPLRGRVERHHRMRRRDGGDRLSNLLMLRPACHHHWTEHPEEARQRGLIVPALTGADPANVPVLWHGRSWTLLGDDGGTVRTSPPPTTEGTP